MSLGQTLIVGTASRTDMLTMAMKETGTTAPSYGVMAEGSDGTNARFLKTDSAGALVMSNPTPAYQNVLIDGGWSTVTVVAGSAIIGKVGIDQTTPGTTNAVQLLASSAVVGHVIQDTGSTTVVTGNVAVTHAAASITGSNPCSNPTATVIGISGATSGTASVQLVALSGSTKIYVCSMNITGVSGTTPTFKLTYGTGSACATGTVGIVGPITTAANTVYNFVGPTFAVTTAGQALCYVDTGTTPVQQYNITYVQQ